MSELSARAVARLLDVSPERVGQLCSDGVLRRPFEADDCVTRYINYQRSRHTRAFLSEGSRAPVVIDHILATVRACATPAACAAVATATDKAAEQIYALRREHQSMMGGYDDE